MSYYVEEQTPLLEQLIQNCEPILHSLSKMIDVFRNTINEKHPMNSREFLATMENSSEAAKGQKLEKYDIGADVAALSELSEK